MAAIAQRWRGALLRVSFHLCNYAHFSNAKLNLGLYVTAKRPDGYHTLETVFLPLPWTDALEVLPAPKGQAASDLTLTGRPIPGEVATNLCLKAYGLLKADFPQLPAVQMQLHKLVPIGAGLGGGSADAAFALRAIGEVFELICRWRSSKATPAAWGPTALFLFRISRAWRWSAAMFSSPLP